MQILDSQKELGLPDNDYTDEHLVICKAQPVLSVYLPAC